MRKATIDAVVTVLKMDETVSEGYVSEITNRLQSFTGDSHKGQDRYLTADEVAVKLNISKRQVWRFVNEGLLRPIRLSPKVVRFRESDVDLKMSSLSAKHGAVA